MVNELGTLTLAITPEFLLYCKIVAIILGAVGAAFTILTCAFSWFLKETVVQLKSTDEKQWAAITLLQQNANHLAGEHDAMTNACRVRTRRVDDRLIGM